MKSLEWMDIIYPANASLMAGYLVAKISYRLIVRRSLGVISRAWCISFSGLSFWIARGYF